MNIDERLERLEKQMRFYKRLVIVLALVIVAGVTMGQADYSKRVVTKPTYGEEIQATQFLVVDKEGRTRAFIGMFGNDPGIRLYDENGVRSNLDYFT